MTDDIEKLVAFGQMALEQGWYDKARECFDQVLALEATNQEAINGLAQVDEMQRPKPPFRLSWTEETQAEEMSSGSRSIIGWIRKKREERAERIAEQRRRFAEQREQWAEEEARRREALEEEKMRESDLPEDEEVRETDLSGRWDLELPPMDLLIELLRFQCQQLERIEAGLIKQRVILERQTKHLNNISTMASLVMLLIIIGVVLTMCSALSSPRFY